MSAGEYGTSPRPAGSSEGGVGVRGGLGIGIEFAILQIYINEWTRVVIKGSDANNESCRCSTEQRRLRLVDSVVQISGWNNSTTSHQCCGWLYGASKCDSDIDTTVSTLRS